MKGTIYLTNKTRGMYSVKTDNLYIVIEDLDGVDLNYGDIISGIPSGEGDAKLKNLESGTEFSAIIQTAAWMKTQHTGERCWNSLISV